MASLPKAPLDDVRSHSTFRRCSLQFKRGSTIIGGIPFDIKCLAFVTLSSTFQLSGNGRKSHSFFSSLLSPFLLLISFLSPPLSFFPLSLSSFLSSSSSFFFFFYKTSRRKRTRTTRRLESEGTAPRFTRMFFITHRVHGTMWPRQLNTCSRASARQYPHKRERACTDVRAHLTMNARHTPEARPRATHNLARHNAARNCAHQPKSFVSSINPMHKSKRLSSLF